MSVIINTLYTKDIDEVLLNKALVKVVKSEGCWSPKNNNSPYIRLKNRNRIHIAIILFAGLRQIDVINYDTIKRNCGNRNCYNPEHFVPINIKNDIIADVKSIYNKLGYISSYVYQTHGKYSKCALENNFSSWKEILKVANINIDKNICEVSQEDLLNELKRFSQEFGRPPTTTDLHNTAGYRDNTIYYMKFPGLSWGAILKLAGLVIDSKKIGLDNNFYDSAEEANIANILYSNFIEYESHKKVCDNRKWLCDFHLPKQNLWVEYDGLDKWRTGIDKFNDKIDFYKSNNYNFVVLKSRQNVLETLNLKVTWKKNDFSIQFIDFQVAQEFLKRTHYLKGLSKSYKFIVGIYHNIIGLCGVAVYGNSPNSKEKELCLLRFSTLSRMEGCFSSFFLSKSLKFIPYSGKIVSWSDPRYHKGTLYKACNFTSVKKSKYKDYVYVDTKGNEYHKSICRVKAGASEAELAKQKGLIKIDVPPKERWEIII